MVSAQHLLTLLRALIHAKKQDIASAVWGSEVWQTSLHSSLVQLHPLLVPGCSILTWLGPLGQEPGDRDIFKDWELFSLMTRLSDPFGRAVHCSPLPAQPIVCQGGAHRSSPGQVDVYSFGPSCLHTHPGTNSFFRQLSHVTELLHIEPEATRVGSAVWK